MNTLYTFGYQGAALAPFAAWVTAHGAIVVDTRMAPWSPRPEWRLSAIHRALPQGQYKHVRALGNVNYKSGGPIQIADPATGVAVVVALLVQAPVVLLCGCRDAATCHRTVVAHLVAEVCGAEIIHLSTDEVQP